MEAVKLPAHEAYKATLSAFPPCPFLIIGYIVMMIAISWELAVFSVLFLPVVALLIGSIVKRLRHPARTNQQRMGEMVATLDESLAGIKVIKSYNATEYIKQKYYDISEDLARLTLSMARRQQLASPMSEFLGITAVGVILVFGGSLVAAGSLDPGGFIAFVAIFSQITRPVRTFIDQFANINQGIAAGERIFSIIDTKPEIQDKPDARTLDRACLMAIRRMPRWEPGRVDGRVARVLVTLPVDFCLE